MGWSKFDNQPSFVDRSMFVDREEIVNIFNQEYKKFLENFSYFKVIGIYGIGGIGKSRLIEQLLESIKYSKLNSHIITINMEIMHSAEIFDNLIKVRKQIASNCYYFDYALLMLWDIYKIERVDDDFMHVIKGNFLTMLNMTENLLSNCLISPGFENVLSLIRKNIVPIVQRFCLDTAIIKEIEERFKYNPERLYEYMPHLLGIDLARIADEKRLIAFFDSYERYIVDHDDWLKELIGSAGVGLFIIASREELDWNVEKEQLIPYHLQELPPEHASTILKCKLQPEHYPIIDTILTKTQCVPIYIELAVNIYKSIIDKKQDTVEKEFWLIHEKKDFIKKFLRHLPDDDREIVLLLSVIRIYNASIFEWIVKDLHLQYDVLKFNDLCKLCLVNLLKEDDKFYKLHDVFTSNAVLFIDREKKNRIFKSYIKYIGNKGVIEFSARQLSILFRNLLTIAETIDFDSSDLEFLCDIFFELYENKGAPELFEWVESAKASTLEEFKQLVTVLYLEKRNAGKSYEYSLLVTTPERLGRHINSFKLIQNYAVAIVGKYEESEQVNRDLYQSLQPSDSRYWYYGKTKIYYADHLMLQGKFIDALRVFKDYENELGYIPNKEGDHFEIQKQSAHCYRFNMFLEDAYKIYCDLKNEYSHYQSLMVYIAANLCETNCYFEPEFVFRIQDDAVKLCKQMGRPKDLAKVYYSVAIANLHKNEYQLAYQYIQKSILLNEEAHYPSGILFAMMAQAYLEYACRQQVSEDTVTKIKNLLNQIQVYQYFELPLALLTNDVSKLTEINLSFEWIDFQHTVQQYQKFFSIISYS